MPAHAILIVEDEPLIAMMLEDFLAAIGKRVIGPAESVMEALALIAAGGIDAAILDVNLRDGDKSWAVARALNAAGIPFLFASGGGGELVPEEFAGCPALDKPFTLDGVSQAIDALG